MSNLLPPTDSAAIKTLKLLEALCAHPVAGASNKELAAQTGLSPVQITRAYQELHTLGWAQQDGTTGNYLPTARFSRLAFKVLAAFDAAEKTLADSKRNFTTAA